MTYFDTSLELDPITEQQSTPVLPEERHVFELVGFERSEPDQWRKEGGIKWTFRVFEEDGRTPFVFNDEQYLFYRTTNVDKKTLKPLFTVGYSANDWASALLGRTLAADAHFSVTELRNKRMSAMVTWKRQVKDKTKWSVELASLRHVPVAPLTASAAGVSKSAVPADADTDEIDRKLAISKFERKLERARKKKMPALPTFEAAYGEIETATLAQVDALIESIDDAMDAMDA
jgi:hypothetical protein